MTTHLQNHSEMDNAKIPIPKIKRGFDILFSFMALIILSPIFILILFAIFMEHIALGNILSSLFYVETRISQGEPFRLLKFNIFKPSAIKELEQEKKIYHSKDLERQKDSLTITGKILKQTYIDELPQLLNILKGDMSFVGPRPIHIKVYARRLEQGDYSKSIVKAGITGNFQSLKGITTKTDRELDWEYINFCKNNPGRKIMLYDIKIILRTVRIMIKAQGI